MKKVVVEPKLVSRRTFVQDFKKRGGTFGGLVDFAQSVTFLLYPKNPTPGQLYEMTVPKPKGYDSVDVTPLIPVDQAKQVLKALNLA